MLEQMTKWMASVDHPLDEAEAAWIACCKWFLELHRDHKPGRIIALIHKEIGIDIDKICCLPETEITKCGDNEPKFIPVEKDIERETHHCYWIGHDNRCRKDNRFCVGRVVCSVYEKGEKI